MSGNRKNQPRAIVPTSAHQTGGDPVTVNAGGVIQVNLADAPVPTNEYDADYAWAVERLDSVSLFFAKTSADGSLRSRLEIRYAPEAFVVHFWPRCADFYTRLRAFMAGRVSARIPDPLKTLAIEKEHSAWANLEVIAHHGNEACIDFFRMAPHGIARFKNNMGTSALKVDPIVRIHTTSGQIAGLLADAESLAARLKASLQTPEESPNE